MLSLFLFCGGSQLFFILLLIYLCSCGRYQLLQFSCFFEKDVTKGWFNWFSFYFSSHELNQLEVHIRHSLSTTSSTLIRKSLTEPQTKLDSHKKKMDSYRKWGSFTIVVSLFHPFSIHLCLWNPVLGPSRELQCEFLAKSRKNSRSLGVLPKRKRQNPINVLKR